MALTKTIEPYEFVARFANGKLVGAHTASVTIIKDGDEVISTQVGGAEPISIEGKSPIADILGHSLMAALTTAEDQATELTVVKARVEELERTAGCESRLKKTLQDEAKVASARVQELEQVAQASSARVQELEQAVESTEKSSELKA